MQSVVAHFLDGQIAAHVGDLGLERVGVRPVADRRTQECGQRARHLHDLLAAPGVAHPDDGIERIIEEMRLDLRLQRLPFALALLLLAAQPFVHQFGSFGDHVVKAVGQLAKLRAGGYLAAHVQIAVLHAPHRLRQPADGVGDGARELKREHQRKDERRRRDEQIGLVDPVPAAQQLLRIGDAHGGPARRLRRAGDVEFAAAPLAEEHPAVFGREHLLGVLLLQPRVNEILLRVPEDAARPVDEVDIAPAAQLDIRAEPVDDLIVEVDQQHALHLSGRVEHGLGKGDDPVVLPRDQIFHAGRRDLDLIRVRQRVHVPVRRVIIGIGIERRALASEQRPARLRDKRDRGDLRADLLCGGQLLLRAAAGGARSPPADRPRPRRCRR